MINLRSLMLICFLFLPLICYGEDNEEKSPVNTYEECVKRGYQVVEKFPPVCVTPDGKTFKQELIEIPAPKPGLGICKNLCGDGSCQEIVCMGSGCPCSENKEKCPEDCSR